jgi:uncharacterized protein
VADDSEGGTSRLKDRLSAEMREAMKGREKVRLSALRLLAAAVKNREVELRHPLSDDEFVEVATHEVKRRKEAIAAYDSAGRPDRASVERLEREILEAYLPAGLSEEEVKALIEEAVAASGASTPGDMGAVMGYVMARARGRVDGKTVQQQVRERLGA